MTKARAPLTFENAQSRVSGHIGADALVEAAGQPSRTVYDWGDPDNDRSAPIAAALRMDLAHIAAGGEGAPFYETYGKLLKAAAVHDFADSHALIHVTAEVMKESGEAGAAMALASLPGATDAVLDDALREAEHGHSAFTRAISLLKGMRRKRAPP